MNTLQRVRDALCGWISGLICGIGLGLFPWANPYIALSLVLGGLMLWAVIRKAILEAERGERR